MIACTLCASRVYAQTDTIRYVRMSGSYNNNGRSWATAKNNVQDAINDLRDYLKINNLTSGSVYIAEGTYVPSESTEAYGGSMLNTSFKIYDGIHVYGGFSESSPEATPGDRLMSNNKRCADNWADPNGVGTVLETDIASQWDLKYKTILSGNHSSSSVILEFDEIRGRYNATYPASSYHVVWFGTNGTYATTNDSITSHYKPLEYPASLDGCVITEGNASSRSTSIREHTAYGGGVYMVGNSELRNCTVEKCSATLRGGGVYLDGGGKVDFCYIHTCQASGVGVVQGYGGGACIEYDGEVSHSHITNCTARCGGGLSICHVPGEYPVDRGISYYSPFSAACVINNNTASAEAGGIYLVEGGTINHATVTANNCISPDVTYYGRRHGRSGGIYIRDCGMIYNSVFWGNKCATNNDIQFASVRQVADTTGHEIFVYHTAFMNHDISDWTGAQKEVVFSLDKHNLPLQGSSNNFPCFFSPTVNPDNWDDASLPGAGVFKKLVADNNLSAIPGPRIWHLTSYSALDQKGVQVTDAIQGVSQWILHAHTDYGVVTNPFRPVSTLGALVRRSDPVTYALIAPQGQEGRAGGAAIPTIFIDPGRKGVFDAEGKFVYQDKEGYSWDHPIRDIGEAIQFFRQYLVDDPGGTHHYMLPALEGGLPTGEKQRYDYVQILVKEGTINTAGPGNYLDKNIRTAAVRVESHMRLYGGYPTGLEGTDTGTRNPRDYVTTITANVTGIGGTRGYENNSAHVIAMVNVEHAVVDGFTLADANTHNIIHSHSAPAGGGVLVNNVSVDPEKRIDMTGNQLRNCVITNCSSPKGAAVYVNGEHKHADGTVCYAELKMVNCVIRNNMADYQGEGGTINDHGIITANGRAYIEVEHCDVVNNVGYPFKADSKQTESDDPITCSHPEHSYHSFHGFIRVNNSLIFCNGDQPLDNRGDLGTTAKVMSVFPDGQKYVFGEYNMFDRDLRLQIDSAGKVCPRGFFDPAFSYTVPDDFLPAGSSFGSSLNASLPSEKNNKAIFTRTDNTASTYPGFVNPSRNVGNSTNGDKPLYGGIVSYAPLTTNPCVNAANASYYIAVDNYDRTDNCMRDRGGAPDIGAIENTDLPDMGSVIYVTPNGAGKRDGSSWNDAIAGNTVYRLYGAPAAEGDSIDVASNARLINKSTGEPVLTTDDRYCGGYAMKYVYPIFHDYGKNYTRTVELNAYIGGEQDGHVDTLSNVTTSTTNITERRYNNGTIPDTIVSLKAINAAYPYGEMSGTSRYVYRAQGNYSPLTEDGGSLMFSTPGMTTIPSNAAGVVNSGHLTLTNERKENYVSGLQYAVEKASALNKSYHQDSVQVWIGAGHYSDYKGYVMRDSVSVYGGFPATKYKAPGMEERRALMSNVVAIPKSKENKDLDAADYETVLQISDVNPRSSNTAINEAAIKFNDNGQSVKLYIHYNISNFTDNTTIHYYRWDEGEGDYVLDHDKDTVVNSSSVKTTWSDELYDTAGKTRNVLRKRVLQMPDVTATTYIHGLGSPTANAGGKYADNLHHYERLIKEGRMSNVNANGSLVNGRHQDPNYKEYNKVYWDGFTIRHGFLYNQRMAHGGGAGVCMYEGARLVNCIVTDNWAGAGGVKGGGVFCDGSTSTIENCFILNNTLTQGTGVNNNTQGQQQGGGMFLYEGTCFNTLIANNWANGPGGALGLCVAKFYNNTLSYNTSNNGVGGVRIAVGSAPAIFMANTIIYGNSGLAIDITSGTAAVAPFINCYIQSATQITKDNFLKALGDHKEGVTDGFFGRKNNLYNKVAPNKDNTPFAADIVNGSYIGGSKTANDFALRQKDGKTCINAGEEDFEGAMYEAVRAYLQRTNAALNPTDANIRKETFYKNVVGAQLPSNDVVYAKRVQDCQVDIGAYEFNAAYSIKPDTTTHPGQAIFYVMFDSPGGDASADSPANAACKQKLQQVLDAAGRYKNKLMTESRYSTVDATPVADSPKKDWTVEVWLAGDSTNCTTSSTYADWYTPTRSTKHSDDTYMDNTLDYSFIIPHGIQVKGGYKPGYFHTEGGKIVDDRDPLTYRSVLSGKITSSTGAEGQTYHVITFTNDLFDGDENRIGNGNQLDTVFSGLADAEAHRAVVDGVFIEDGYANSPDDEDRIGAGAVVTGYAHICNCVIQNNTAGNYGGGLYLKPQALVSGTIIKKNSADIGGGIYIEAPAGGLVDSLAHIFSTTICENSANTTAGGMWFYETNARVNSTALWHNTANDFSNVSGTFARTSDETDYPFTYCAVESRRLEGLGNIELSPRETEGVRWDASDPFHAILYYPIEMSSTLSRAGMTYREWEDYSEIYLTLDSTDIAGVSRLTWSIPNVERGFSWGTDTLVIKDNDFIEIGARAINKSYGVNVDPTYVMRRLYVMHTELLNSDAARTLQNNPADDDISNMYRQMGSCTLNPFHRLGDALDYIISARKKDPAKYRNARFEVYIEKGTYYPYHNAYGEQDEVRTNTFLIPEATTMIGGINSQLAGHNYCQAGYIDKYTNTKIGDADFEVPGTGYTLNYALADSIRLRDDNHRPMSDYNLNSVVEPWELQRQTILSGNAVSGEAYTHVYHVITVHADSIKIGAQPLRYAVDVPDADWENGESLLTEAIPMDRPDLYGTECDLSVSARSIILDGITITGGYANRVDTSDVKHHPYQGKTYFRGGGILVDGNWTQTFETGDHIPNVTHKATHNIPLIIRNCQFKDNMAGNGGAIYSNGNLHVYNSHFTQNYSQGPTIPEDTLYIPWSAGGCIAANAYCGIVNSLFDNNEAKRGLYPIKVHGEDSIPDADARQGFGGVLSIAQDAKLRATNCHFMKNKAVAYSAVYNFLPNSNYSTADSMQFVFNSLFWGNEVFDVDNLDGLPYKEAPSAAAKEAFATKFKPSRAGVFHYDGAELAKYNKLYHEYDSIYQVATTPESITDIPDTFSTAVLAKLAELRAQGDKMEGLYFCAYRRTYGPEAMRPNPEGYMMTKAEQRAYTDARQFSVKLKEDPLTHDMVEDYANLFSYVHGNNNVLINRINTAADGPNFRQPSVIAGLDGYMQNADWLLTRMNVTTDQGWGHLKQRVDRVPVYKTRYTGNNQYATADEALAAAQAIEPSATKEDDVFRIASAPVATFDGVDQSGDTAMFNYIAQHVRDQFKDYATPYVPIGSEPYMSYSMEASSGQMYRISSNPRPKVEDVYIDMGVYEYQYINLDLNGNEVDTVWVATKTKGMKHDGLNWETPTTDLQSAIDLLMSSHNNHDKYVCFLGDPDGSIAPTSVLDNRRSFLVSSNSIAPLLPDSAMADYDYAVKSLTFLGGYDYDVKDAPRDPEAHPTIIEMPNVGNHSQLNQLFVIEDMTRIKLQANWMGEYKTRDTVVIPVTFDGITFMNPYATKDAAADTSMNLGGMMNQKGGAAIYYRWQRQYEGEESGTLTPNFNIALHPDSVLLDGEKRTLPKLTISNCIFKDNGARGDIQARSPTVRIDQGGGASLIVNSLFHSNAGAPIYAKRYDNVSGENNLASVPNDVVIVNSTFALNDGHITLKSDNSQIHNSLIWLDDLANDTLTQLEMGDDVTLAKWDKTTNKNRIGIANRVTNNAFWGCFQAGDETYRNESLSTGNYEVFEGPCFMSPDIAATTSAARRARDFRLNPGVKTMNMADTTLYRDRVFFRMYPDTSLTTRNKLWRRANGFKSVDIVTLAKDSDLAAKPRLFGEGMERGAYECRAVLQRIVYVQPDKPSATAGDGSSWRSPFGQGQLQNALDVAALYTYMNREIADPESRKSYVFVKGSYDANDVNALLARDGVNIYGGLPGNFNDTAWIDPSQNAFTNAECRRYVNYVRALSTGAASPNATPTRLNSLTMPDADPYATGFLLDGFVFTNPGETLTESPVVLNDPKATIRNCIITDNTVTGASVVDVSKGLLYNSLLYNNTSATVVKLGANGLALNNTVVTKEATDTPIDLTDASAEASVNNIAGHTSELHCFAPYLTDKNVYTLPAYLTSNGALAYQLHEHSTMINTGTEMDALPAAFAPYKADSTVHFGHDRDLLGNPRRVHGTVDMGAYETWRVAPKQAMEITALTNAMLDETDITIRATDQEKRESFLQHYGGNQYPHAGSVVYLMDSSALSMQYETDGDFTDFNGNDIIFRPGYMLLKPGASFYGNGHKAQMGYVAAEKRFLNQQYSMTAFPFAYNVSNALTTRYYSADDSIAYLASPSFGSYTYNGIARSAKDYVFKPNNSALWQPVTATDRTATDGYLMDFGATVEDTIIRFTGFGAAVGQYVYSEAGDDKIVYLDQHDNRIAGTGESLNFTRQEDMGWNMKGLPWLVSGYRTDTVIWADNYLRQMHIPHVLYQMDGVGNFYQTVGDNVYTTRSWDKGNILSMGTAFLTQTATTQDREAVLFHLPLYLRNEKASRPLLRFIAARPSPSPVAKRVAGTENPSKSSFYSADILTAQPDSTASKKISYSYGRDGLKWQANEDIAQIYMLDNKRQSRISLLGAAPTEVDIPLGVKIPESAGETNTFIFNLPEKEAFADYSYVWLIDYKRNRFTNLLDEDCEVMLEPGENNTRFALRIGGFPKTDEKGKRQYVVYSYEGTLFVRGLVPGDRITIYSPSGKLVHSALASDLEWSTPLFYQNGYVVKVNDVGHKVLNM